MSQSSDNLETSCALRSIQNSKRLDVRTVRFYELNAVPEPLQASTTIAVRFQHESHANYGE